MKALEAKRTHCGRKIEGCRREIWQRFRALESGILLWIPYRTLSRSPLKEPYYLGCSGMFRFWVLGFIGSGLRVLCTKPWKTGYRV